jgi:hypothetical protein
MCRHSSGSSSSILARSFLGRVAPGNFTPRLLQILDVYSRIIRLVPPTGGCRLPSKTPGSSGFPLTRGLDAGAPPPFARRALPSVITITEESAPACRIGTFGLGLSPLCLFLWHRQAGSHSFTQKPGSNSAPSTPTAVRTVLQAPCGLVPGEICTPGFDDKLLTTRLRRFACAHLLDTHLPQVVPGTFDPTLTTAAFGRSGSDWFETCA